MPDDSVECTLGRLQADTANMKDTLQAMHREADLTRQEMRKYMAEQDKRLRTIEDTILTARVSWRTAVFIGSAAATVGGAIWGLVHFFYDPIMKVAKSILGV